MHSIYKIEKKTNAKGTQLNIILKIRLFFPYLKYPGKRISKYIE